jgi:RimJ/RimL family protein N-acetyltransferase
VASDQAWKTLRLDTERLVLRPPSREDADDLSELFTDDEVTRGSGVEPASSPEGLLSIIESMLARWEADAFGAFIIETRFDRRVVGNAGLMVFDTRDWTPSTWAEAGSHGQPELGWALIRAHWGHGYATEAAAAIRAWGRRARSIDRLVSLIAPDNVRSQRVAERLGATPGDPIVHAHTGLTALIWEHPAEARRV